MTRVIHVNDEWHGHILRRRMSDATPFIPGFDQCVSVTRAGKLLGGVIYDHFYGPSIEMHMAGITPDWVSRELIWACFDYPFNQLGVNIVFGPVPSTKGYVLDLDRRLGFVEHTRLKGAVPGGDLVILSMERHQCRWLNRPKVPAHG